MPAHLLATARLALKARSEDTEDGDNCALFSFEPLRQQSSSSCDFVRRKRCLDVYRDPIPPAEARKAQAMINRVQARVLHVLEEWPEHPALLKVGS